MQEAKRDRKPGKGRKYGRTSGKEKEFCRKPGGTGNQERVRRKRFCRRFMATNTSLRGPCSRTDIYFFRAEAISRHEYLN